ncbi:unnamed protein product [Fraxinus pennsylvanica]|uniref:Uncharacterized protein n=1 Tax=Fraxinus pennsylvanica TaxID=56036 RepID=A0AAD2E2S5_9LAMI|nr:unnamed protein product [Fraxinus pennsylvanica]
MEKEEDGEAAAFIWDCGSPLYDSYELVSFTYFIERHMMVLPSQFESSTSKRHVMVLPSSALSESSASRSSEKETTGMKMKKFFDTKDKVKRAKSRFYSFFCSYRFMKN